MLRISRQGLRRRSAIAGAGALLMCAMAMVGASSAWAGPSFNVGASLPASVTVNSTTPVGGSVRFTNQSFSDAGVGEVGYEFDSFQLDTFTLVASCGSTVAGADCPVGSKDPGVIVPQPLTGAGVGGVCVGRQFAIAPVGPAVDAKYSFSVSDGGGPIIVGPVESAPGVPTPTATRQCVINYTFVVPKAPDPLQDSQPGTPGLQTDQKAFASFTDLAAAPNPNAGRTGGGLGTTGTTVNLAQPVMATTASPTSRWAPGR